MKPVWEQAESIIAKHRRHVQMSPGVGKEKQDYAIACLDDVADDLARHLVAAASDAAGPSAKAAQQRSHASHEEYLLSRAKAHYWGPTSEWPMGYPSFDDMSGDQMKEFNALLDLLRSVVLDSLRPYRELLATMRGRQTELLKPQYMMKTEELGKFQSLIYEWCADELEAILKEAGK